MSKLLSLFLDRLAERLSALMAGVISSRVEGLHAAAQADQQSQLEDLARKYEADGKAEIATTLRRRLARMTSPDLATEAAEALHQLADDRPRCAEPPVSGPQTDLRGLPDFSVPSVARGKKRRMATDPSPQQMNRETLHE
jgi:hypothetical protein